MNCKGRLPHLLFLTALALLFPVPTTFANSMVAGYWTLTGSLATPRFDHGIALLYNGKVLVTGGRIYDSVYSGVLASSELYDPLSGTWSTTGSLNDARFWFRDIVTLYNGKVLIAGGSRAGLEDLASAELYDPAKGSWSYTGSLNTPRRLATLTLLNDGRVLIAGGEHEPNPSLASAEIYDPATGTWSYTGSLNFARRWHLAARLLDGRVLVAGGEGSTGTHIAEIYDPATGNWSTTGSMSVPTRIEGAIVVLKDGRVLVVGGWDRYTFFNSAELYDPATGTWTLTSPMHVARARPTVTLLPDGRVLVAGGCNWSGSQASSEIYDPTTGTWSFDANLQVSRAAHMAVTLFSGKILAVGGWTGHPSTGISASSEFYTLEGGPEPTPFLSSPCGSNCVITSYFDHSYPTYRNVPNCCLTETFKTISTYWAANSRHEAWYLDSSWHFRCDQPDTRRCWSYSGHDGYDYAGFETVVAAAGGQVVYVGCANHRESYPCPSSYGFVVDIDHRNGYLTRYGHLKQASVRVGDSVNAGQQIGLVGKTGFATGEHLHFMVYQDVNGNRLVDSLDIPVDPYGPNPPQGDLWRAHVSGTSSHWLWMESPPTSSNLVPTAGGALRVPDGDVIVTVPAGAIISNTTLYYTAVPEPPYTHVRTGAAAAAWPNGTPPVPAGHTFHLSARDEAGNPITALLAPATMTITFVVPDLTYVNSATLGIYLWDENTSIWTSLPANLSLADKMISATITALGTYSLRGLPNNPPPVILAVDPAEGNTIVDTQIRISGSNFLDTPFVRIGEWYLTDVRLVSPSILTATIPAGFNAGIYDIAVENPDGQSATLLNAFVLFNKIYLPLILKSY